MNNDMANIEKLVRSNRRLKAACALMGAALALMVGLNFEGTADAQPGLNEELVATNAVSVDDSTGFAVFVRHDGKLVIVKEDGTVIQTDGHPMAVGF